VAKVGFVDSIEDGVISGWALDESTQSPAVVDISIDGVVVAKVTCCEFRPDLVRAHRGNGWHGFSYPLPPKYIQCRGKLIISFSDGGPVLNNGQRLLTDFTNRFLTSSALFASVMRNGLWCIDSLDFSDSEVLIEGWCIPPRVVPVATAFTHNGDVLTEVTRFARNDLALKLDMQRDEMDLGFRARGPLLRDAARHDFCCAHAATKRAFDSNQSVHYIRSAKPMPPAELRIRVHGSEDVASFVKEGSTAYVQIQRVLKDYFSKSLEDFTQILDWGCGSGRTLRYFAENISSKVTGVDIDPQAIEWCRQAYPQGRFETVGMNPPMLLPSESFDLIFGISVLTHLREKDHIRWLQELQRVAKPEAVLLLTFNGDWNFWKNKFPSRLYTQWKISGFFEGGRNTDLDPIGTGDYYRNAHISHDYIWRNWSRYFNIIDLVPMGISNAQDLAILQKRE
jgi:SAM-dependent methyltransferase